jgi:hypothetical protein
VGSPAQSAVATLVGTSVDEGPQLLLVRWEGVPVLGPALPWHVGHGEAVLAAREDEVASLAASTDGVFLTRIGLDARAIGNPQRLSPDDGSGGSRPSIVPTAGGYVALWHSGGAVRVVIARVGEDGSLGVTPRASARDEPAIGEAVLATAAGRHALVGRVADDLVVVRFGDNGRTIGRPTVVAGALAGVSQRIAAAIIGRRLFVAVPAETPRVVVVE